jgi:hypothetical protein
MRIFENLTKHTSNTAELSTFINDNLPALYDYLLTQRYEELRKVKDEIETYILNNLKLFDTLDFAQVSTRVFITLLLDVAMRFSFLMPLERLYRLLHKNDCEVGHRHAAAKLIFTRSTIIEYSDRIEAILEHLLASLEDDNTEDRIIETIVVLYTQVILTFGCYNSIGVEAFRKKLLTYRKNARYFFLENEILNQILALPLETNSTVVIVHIIQEKLDVFLNRRRKYYPDTEQLFLIENEGNYSNLLNKIQSNYGAIQSTASNEYQKISDNRIFYSLQRGVEVLTTESQLYAYMHSYGKMHNQKISQSIVHLPPSLFNQKLDVIDWGCGQGIASLALLDHLNDIGSAKSITNITLVEPSEIAIKRASLHVRKLNSESTIYTIMKDMDSLKSSDFGGKHKHVKLHLLSNIIDVDLFSLAELIALVKRVFKGENYFICASPYINEMKVNRVDSFVDSFSNNKNFERLNSTNDKKGEWQNNWTRVIRVFKVTL